MYLLESMRLKRVYNVQCTVYNIITKKFEHATLLISRGNKKKKKRNPTASLPYAIAILYQYWVLNVRHIMYVHALFIKLKAAEKEKKCAQGNHQTFFAIIGTFSVSVLQTIITLSYLNFLYYFDTLKYHDTYLMVLNVKLIFTGQTTKIIFW